MTEKLQVVGQIMDQYLVQVNDLICCSDGTWARATDSYLNVDDIPARFNVDDYEVFQVIKK